jgi:3-dehydroquinate synthase
VSAPHRVAVPSGARAEPGYEILIGAGVWEALPQIIERHCPAHRYAVVSDDRVAALYAVRLLRTLHAAGHRADVFAFPAGEAHKTRDTWASLSDAMLEAGIGRDSVVIALGGGVPGDLGGFIAATYMRGLPVVQVPTTLLAMIDASVGGKTGVDTPAGKNLIGAFHRPRAVVIDPELLATLPDEQLRAGFAEAVKHAAIADAEYLGWMEDSVEALLAGDPAALAQLILRSVEIKAEIVARDEREAGPRAALNFGHTVAHALELLSGYEMLHGQAVAIGMVVEARAGERAGVTAPGTAERLRRLLGRLGLPTSVPPELSADEVVVQTGGDKKARQGRTEYALVERIGSPATTAGRWATPVAGEVVRAAMVG